MLGRSGHHAKATRVKSLLWNLKLPHVVSVVLHKAGAGSCCQKEMEFPVQFPHRHLCMALLTLTGWCSCQKDVPWAGRELWLWAQQFLGG